jgi:hypothetical protein
MKDCKLTSKQSIYQFILAIETAYPDYARQRRADLRNGTTPIIDKMCNKLIDEARRDDPIKIANVATKQQSGGDSSNNNTNNNSRGGRSGRGRERNGQSGNNKGDRQQAEQRAEAKPATATKAYCKHCDFTHYGGGNNCWYTFPEKATDDWRRRNADKIKTKSRANAATVKQQEYYQLQSRFEHLNFFSPTTPIVNISDKVRNLAGRNEYQNRLILDTGATDHLCNDYNKFVSFDNGSYHAVINTGAGPITVTQKGTIKVNTVCSDGTILPVTFSNVLYAPQMFVSVLSHSMLRKKNLYYHGYDHKLYLRRGQHDSEVAYTPEVDKIPTFLLADDELQAAQSLAFASVGTTQRNSILTPTRDVSLRDLHTIFGHADIQTLRHLVDSTTGLRLTDTKNFLCEVCLLGNSRQRVSRQSPNRSTRFLHRVHIDIVGPVTPTGANGEKYWIIYTDDFSRYQWIDITDSKQTITSSLLNFLDRMETQYGVRVAICHLDNDTTLINKVSRAQLSHRGTVFEPSTPYTAHQNGVAESSNRLTESRSRNIIIGAPHIPKKMWPYAARYSIELLNHTPTTAVADGKTPQRLRLEHMKVVNPVPNLHSFRRYGETGYVHTPAQKRVQSAKFEPRATKMYFVGRDGSRIYLMWDPKTDSVHRTSSVGWAKHELVEAPQAPTVDSKFDDSTDVRFSIPLLPTQSPPPLTDQEFDLPEPGQEEDQPQEPGDVDGIEQGTGFTFDGLVDEGTSFNFDEDIYNLTVMDPSLEAVANVRASPPRHEAPRHLDISASCDVHNILSGKRTRRPTQKVSAVAIALHKPRITPYLARCFATAIATAPTATKLELPPEPTSMKQARQHMHKDGWISAEGAEYKSHDENSTWEIVTMPPAGIYALPTKWIYKYKLTDCGKLERFKARLVVCGNRQELDFWRETYAAVARATTLKVLLALVATLDLECDQADVVTAFLNGRLDAEEAVYIRLPDGRKAKLHKALYGLRRSPRLWYEELSRFLKTIGFTALEADPRVFKHEDGSHILAYVDDLIFITKTRDRMDSLKRSVFNKYKCRDLGPIGHYLGIRVRRDRPNRSIELSMESYIEKLVDDYQRANSAPRYTPLDMSVLHLKMRLSTDKAPEQQVQNYQRIIGKLLYPATQLRTDISFHVSFLARAMNNPTPSHYDYALQIIDYLKTHKDLAMTYNAPKGATKLTIDMFATASPNNLGLHAYSDASFADGEDRKSTSGYLFKLAGGTICHKSFKQKLVTTSTTEAEYVALTFAAKEATWLYRLLHQVGYKSEDTYPITIYGDNEPSIKLLHAKVTMSALSMSTSTTTTSKIALKTVILRYSMSVLQPWPPTDSPSRLNALLTSAFSHRLVSQSPQ